MRKWKQSVKAWLEKAELDWKVVRLLLRAEKGLWGVICFHAQQAVEKWLKAYLIHCRVVPKRTHDLVALLDEVGAFDPRLVHFAEELKSLSRFAVTVRYPGMEEPGARECRAVVKSAGRVRKAILGRIEGKSVKAKAVRAKKK